MGRKLFYFGVLCVTVLATQHLVLDVYGPTLTAEMAVNQLQDSETPATVARAYEQYSNYVPFVTGAFLGIVALFTFRKGSK